MAVGGRVQHHWSGINFGRPSSFRRPRTRGYTVWVIILVCVLALLYGGKSFYASDSVQSERGEPYLRDATSQDSLILAPSLRLLDLQDSFAKYAQSPECQLSSLELHEPFHPLCATKEELLRAVTDGGRIGVDAPYVPRGCDMRWYHLPELCRILSNFEKIHVIGDSMIRNLAVAMNTLIRGDLIKGPHLAVREDPEGVDCYCSGVFGGKPCIFNAAYSSQLVRSADEGSPIQCARDETALIEFDTKLKFPLAGEDLFGLTLSLPRDPYAGPVKPHAFVMGHGLWNDLNVTATQGWIEQITSTITASMPYLADDPRDFHRLFVTPSASGEYKPEQFLITQGNSRLIPFEKEMGLWLADQGIDHLGTWNLTIQNTSPDGTHAGMRSSLVKAMMVFNWLDRLVDEDRMTI